LAVHVSAGLPFRKRFHLTGVLQALARVTTSITTRADVTVPFGYCKQLPLPFPGEAFFALDLQPLNTTHQAAHGPVAIHPSSVSSTGVVPLSDRLVNITIAQLRVARHTYHDGKCLQPPSQVPA